MSVRSNLDQALKKLGRSADVEEAQRWLARTEILLEWISQHPKLVEINCEAAMLLGQLRGEAVSAIDVDYRGIGNRDKPAAEAKPAS